MAITTHNSKDVKYIWNTSDNNLTSTISILKDNTIYAITCAYNDDTADMDYTYYKSTNTTDNTAVWNRLMVNDLDNFDKYFKEVTNKKDIEYLRML